MLLTATSLRHVVGQAKKRAEAAQHELKIRDATVRPVMPELDELGGVAHDGAQGEEPGHGVGETVQFGALFHVRHCFHKGLGKGMGGQGLSKMRGEERGGRGGRGG